MLVENGGGSIIAIVNTDALMPTDIQNPFRKWKLDIL
jgi:hypothetical protein